MPHVVAADDIRTVGQPTRMAIICGPQQHSGRIDGAAGYGNDVRGKAVDLTIMFDHHAGNFSPRMTGFELANESVSQKRNVGMAQCRLNAHHLRVGLRMHQARKTVAGAAANAFAGVRIPFVEAHAQGRMKRF